MPEKASNLLYIERKHKKALPYKGGSFRFVLVTGCKLYKIYSAQAAPTPDVIAGRQESGNMRPLHVRI